MSATLVDTRIADKRDKTFFMRLSFWDSLFLLNVSPKLTYITQHNLITTVNIKRRTLTTKRNLPRFSMPDRKLGNEWLNWQGDMQGSVLETKAGKRIFMGVLLISWICMGGFSAFSWYLVAPRLAQFHALVPLYVALALGLVWMVFGLWFALTTLSLITQRDLLFHMKGRTISLTFLIPMAFKLGHRLGISKDKLSHSFVNVSNLLIRTRVRKIKADELMILLPRCLHPTLLKQILQVTKTLGVSTFTVSGGSKARRLILENRPKAVIGVACERDLLSGIQDVINKLPVIGIPNQRPEGPCKNTRINWPDLEAALTTFLKNETQIHELCIAQQ